MFYNTYRATKSAMRRRELSATGPRAFVNPKERLLNLQKRQKLKELLITKFSQKYSVKNPQEILEPVINEFIQQEKLNDNDLKRLDIKIKNLLKDKISKDNLKSTLTHNLQDFQSNQNEVKNELNTDNNQSNNVVDNTLNNNLGNQNTKNNNEFPNINNLNDYKGIVSQTENNLPRRGKSSYMRRGKTMNCFKSPEEELAHLEKEIAELEAERKPKYKNPFKNIEYEHDKDEWSTIVKYNKKLFDRQVLEDKMRDKVNKRRTKEFLDHQIQEKIKKEYEDELKEKEYNKIMEEHTKKMDEMERIKAQKIKEQIQRLKENRDEQLKNERTRKKIEELKQKKFDLNLVKNYEQNMEKIRQQKLEMKKRENDALRKAINENEQKKQRLKEQFKKEREDEIKMNEERMRIRDRQDQERKRYYDNIKNNGNKYSLKQAEEILEQMKKAQKAEDEKMQYYSNAKREEADAKEVKEHIRRQKEREDMKRYYDMQIEEKEKEKQFNRALDEEQARIWNIDCKKFYDEERTAEQKIKLMNKINFDCLTDQIEAKKRSKSKKNYMTNTEFAMNRDLIEKARQEEQNPTPMPQV